MWEVSVELGAVWCSVSSVEDACVSVKEMHVSVYRLSMVTSIIYGVSSLSLSSLAHQQSIPFSDVLDALQGVRAPVDGNGDGPNHDRGEAERCVVGGGWARDREDTESQ